MEGRPARSRILAVGVLAAILGIAAYLASEPTYDPTDAEIASALGQALRYEPPEPPPDGGSFRLFEAAGASIDREAYGRVRLALTRNRWMGAYLNSDERLRLATFVRNHSDELKQVLGASKMAPPAAPGQRRGLEWSAEEPYMRALDLPLLNAVSACVDGSDSACSKALVQAAEVSRAACNGRVPIRELYMARINQRRLHSVIRYCMLGNKLDAAALRKLAAYIHAPQSGDPELALALKGELHARIQLLAKRNAFAQTHEFPAGDWNGLENVQRAAAIANEALTNLHVPFDATSSAAIGSARRWAQKAPSTAGASGGHAASHWLSAASVRIRLRNLPNGLGRTSVARNAVNLFDLGNSSHRYRTACERMRLQLAAAAFERERARKPESVRQLIAAGLLSKAPYDHVEGQPLTL